MKNTPIVQISDMTFEDSCYNRKEKRWNASTLYRYAEKLKLKPFDATIASFDLNISAFSLDNLAQFIFQCKRVNDYNLDYPIILDDYGTIADGYHRLCKAILEGKTTIKAIRLSDMPEPDDIINEE